MAIQLKPIKKRLYKYKGITWGVRKVKKVEIDRESEQSVFFTNPVSRARKETHDTVYADTPEEAFEWVKRKLNATITSKRATMDYYLKKLEEFIDYETAYFQEKKNGH